MIYTVHLFQDVRLKILIAGGDVAHDHQMLQIVLDHFSAAIAAIRVMIHDRPPLVLESLYLGSVR